MSTFAPEIAIFAPAQPPRDNTSAAPSPVWQRSSPTAENSSPEAKAGMLAANAAVVEEAAAAQPISMKQRGTRLSFLGGKKKESQQQLQQPNGDTSSLKQTKGDSDSNSQVSRGKDPSNRKSIFRTQSSDTNLSSNPYVQPSPNGVVDPSTPDWAIDRSRKSKEIVDVFERDLDRPNDGGIGFNSVKKRLSMLKLGKKPSKPNGLFMGGVSEE